jgi:CHAT domain-containing protein/tetratricopeptide (TPR) repeat protein
MEVTRNLFRKVEQRSVPVKPHRNPNSACVANPAFLVCVFIIFAALSSVRAQAGPGEPISIGPGTPITRQLKGGQSESFAIQIESGQFLRIAVEQIGIDVQLSLLDPTGKTVVSLDGPNGRYGPEEIAVLSGPSGIYRLEVRSPTAAAAGGQYRVLLIDLRKPTDADLKRVDAESLYVEATMKLQPQRTAASRLAAIEKFQQALLFFQSTGEVYRQAWIMHTIVLLNAQMGQFKKAFDLAVTTLPLVRSLPDALGETSTLNLLGGMADVLGDPQAALGYYNEALTIARASNNRITEASILNNIGKIHNDLADWQRSIEYYNQALPLLRATESKRVEGITLHNIGVAYVGLGDPERALDLFQQALVIRRSVADKAGEADTLTSIGYVKNSLGRSQEALAFYNQALPLRLVVGDRRAEGTTLDHIGISYADMGQPERALEYHVQALERHRAAQSPRTEAVALGNIGHVYGLLDQPQRAIEFYTQAVSIFGTIGDRQNEAKMYEAIARAQQSLGDLTGALKNVDSALNLIESVRSAAGAQQARSAYLASRYGAYELSIDLLMQSHRKDPEKGYDAMALRASERVRARGLIDTLNEAHVDFRQGVDPTLIARERALGQMLNAKAQRQILLRTQKGGSVEELSRLDQEIRGLEADYQQVQAKIRATSPMYASISQPKPLTVPEILGQLGPDTILLEYSLGEKRSYAWAVTSTSIKSYELTSRGEIDKNARKVYELLTARSIAKPDENLLVRQSRLTELDSALIEMTARLSRQVLEPMAGDLGNKRLLIVADGSLQYVPFAALSSASALGRSPLGENAVRPLILDHEIISAPSATALSVQRKNLAGRKPAEKAIVVIADPVFSETDSRLERSGAYDGPPPRVGTDVTRSLEHNAGGDAWRSSIRRLRFTRQEADQIFAIAPRGSSREALDFEAAWTPAMATELSRYRYVHFATHGYLDTERPGLSAIVLSLVNRDGKPQDGFLRAHDIYNLNLPAELVVLSACQTGLGKDIKGEGLVGLTQGFMYAGARRVVVSLWNVNDKGSAQLMHRFYRGMLRDNMTPSAALRSAQIEMLRQKQWQSPYYWAAFTMQGEWE